MLCIEADEIEHMAALIDATGEYYVDNAIKTILMGVATSPPSQIMMARQTYLNMMSGYARTVERIFKEKLREAAKVADEEVTQYLIENGVIE